jgi:hypothetical protein
MTPNNPLSTSVIQDSQRPSEIEEGTSLPQGSENPKLPFLCRKPVRITLYSLLGAFALFMISWGFLPSFLDPTFKQHIEDKEVIAGMNRDQAIAAWGSPYQMNVTFTDRGLRREEWVYEDWIDAGSVQHRYLYFEEGVLLGGWYYKK